MGASGAGGAGHAGDARAAPAVGLLGALMSGATEWYLVAGRKGMDRGRHSSTKGCASTTLAHNSQGKMWAVAECSNQAQPHL